MKVEKDQNGRRIYMVDNKMECKINKQHRTLLITGKLRRRDGVLSYERVP